MKKGIIIVLISLISILIGLNNVNASEISTNVSYLDEQYFEIDSDTNYNNVLDYYTFILNGDNNSHRIKIYLKEYINTSDFDFIQLNYIANGGYKENNNTYENDILNSYCTEWTKNNIDDSYTCTEIQTDFSTIQEYEKDINFYNLTNIMNVYAVTNDGTRINCSVKGNNILCPTKNKIISQFTLDYSFNGAFTQPKFYLYNRYSKFISDNKKINNSIDETNDILTGEQNYDKNPSEEVNGEEEINDYTEKEEQLFSSLDFEGIGDNEIIINPNTSSFIWEIIDRLRGMNGKIVLLMTSILGLGIIKMVLNR